MSDRITSLRISIDTTKLDPANRGGEIAEILIDLAAAFANNSHFDSANHINDVWGACPLELCDRPVGGMTLI